MRHYAKLLTGTFPAALAIATSASGQTPTRFSDIFPGSTSSSPRSLVATSGRLFFIAAPSTNVGREVWSTNGTVAGTVVANLTPGANISSEPVNLTVLDGSRVMVQNTNGDAFNLVSPHTIYSWNGIGSPTFIRTMTGPAYFGASVDGTGYFASSSSVSTNGAVLQHFRTGGTGPTTNVFATRTLSNPTPDPAVLGTRFLGAVPSGQAYAVAETFFSSPFNDMTSFLSVQPTGTPQQFQFHSSYGAFSFLGQNGSASIGSGADRRVIYKGTPNSVFPSQPRLMITDGSIPGTIELSSIRPESVYAAGNRAVVVTAGQVNVATPTGVTAVGAIAGLSGSAHVSYNAQRDSVLINPAPFGVWQNLWISNLQPGGVSEVPLPSVGLQSSISQRYLGGTGLERSMVPAGDGWFFLRTVEQTAGTFVSQLWFTGGADFNTFHIWTAPGTVPTITDSSIDGMTVFNNLLWFAAPSGSLTSARDIELWSVPIPQIVVPEPTSFAAVGFILVPLGHRWRR